jgi:hypothetical protein
MFRTGPGKVVTPQESDTFADWKDFHRDGEEKHFTYNPAADDITTQHRDKFPETDDFEPPEKM